MTEYICKCGKEIQKSTDADVTGNRLENYAPEHECFGCPYVVEVQKWTKYPEFEIIHECEMSSHILNRTTCSGFGNNNNSCAVLSLDFDFLREVADYCLADEHLTINREENGNIFGYKSSYQANGLYRLPIYPTANKAGIAAKIALFEQFFNDDGTRKDTCGDDETEIVQALISHGKALAQMEQGEDVPDINVVSMPDETHEERTEQPRATLVASPLDFASAALAPAFDYSELDPKTVATLHVAENLIFDARKYYMTECANAVGIAHGALCGGVVQQLDNSKHGNRGESTFLAWCESVGLKKSTAYNFLQVDALMKGATEEEQAILEQAPKTLLYAAANPNAPAELVEQVKSGDITTNAEYQKLLKEKQELEREKADLASCLLDLDNSLDAANARAEDAEEQKKRFQASSNEANNLAFEKMAELNKLKREMESRPVEVAVEQPSEADIARYRAEGADAAAKQWRERYENIEAQNLAYRDMVAEKNQQLEELAAYEIGDEDVEQAVRIILSAETTANTMRAALKLFYDVCKETADADDVDKAIHIVQSVYDEFLDALDLGTWTDEGGAQDGI